MSLRNDDSLTEVLKKNPFKPALIKKWKRMLQSFLEGRLWLSDLSFVLDSDLDSIGEYQEKNKGKERKLLHLELLPQPFQGNPRAPIWILMLNPGYSNVDRYDHLGLCPSCDKNLAAMKTKLRHDMFDCGKDKIKALQRRQTLLLQQLRLRKNFQFSILNDAFNTLQHTLEWQGDGGYRWWQNALFGSNGRKDFLLPKCNVEANAKSIGRKLFVLECCPYHSIGFDNKITGGKYMEFWAKLIKWAITADKKFIVRSKSVTKLLHQKEINLPANNCITLANSRKMFLTMGNLDQDTMVYSEICEVLKR